MTDKELLELAARAYNADNKAWECADYRRGFIGSWDPLESDGDALRLAVKLRLDIVSDREDDLCSVWSYGMPDVNVKYGDDPYAATRRAIVRAAAAIGEKL